MKGKIFIFCLGAFLIMSSAVRAMESVEQIAFNCAFDKGYQVDVNNLTGLKFTDSAFIYGKSSQSTEYYLMKIKPAQDFLEDSESAWVAVKMDRSEAFVIDNVENFNKYGRTLDITLISDREFFELTEFFGTYDPGVNTTAEILDDPLECYGGGRHSFAQWFSDNPGYQYHTPLVETVPEGRKVSYYSWSKKGGILYYHVFVVTAQGEILEHQAEELGCMLGPYAEELKQR